MFLSGVLYRKFWLIMTNRKKKKSFIEGKKKSELVKLLQIIFYNGFEKKKRISLTSLYFWILQLISRILIRRISFILSHTQFSVEILNIFKITDRYATNGSHAEKVWYVMESLVSIKSAASVWSRVCGYQLPYVSLRCN